MAVVGYDANARPAAIVGALKEGGDGVASRIAGIAVDTTGSTPILADREGTALSLLPAFADEPDAMFILWKARERDPRAGYAATFLRQMEGALGACLERGIRVVTNAGGLNPRGLAEALTELAGRLGLAPKIAYVEVGGPDTERRIGFGAA